MVCLASELRFGKVLIEKNNQKGDFCKKKIANEEIMCNFVAVWSNYSAIALHLNPRLKYTAKRPIKRQNKVSIFLAYVRYFLYLYTYERASYGHIKSTARHDSRDKVDA